VVLPVLGLLVLDGVFPVPLPQTATAFSRVVVASNGAPLRAFAGDDGVWRYPVKAADVSPLYLQALIAYEDRHFWRHPGVNPLAMGRAVWQSVRKGRLVSGGSTLTMQLARLLDPHTRTVLGKAKQIARALQLEWRLSKQQILRHYLNFAPFGGPLEGVEAASYAYLGKSAKELSHAEAALLAILPQAPSRLRPDRFPERARRARDKVLRRMQAIGLWSARSVREAMTEPLSARFESRPIMAPLLARRLLPTAKSGEALRTTIDHALQWQLESRLSSLAADLPARTSVALLVVENTSLAVRAYVGSVAYADAAHYGYVDMVRAVRSPGSTLKPFLYGFALEDGLIHSESLLSDVPLAFGAYRPANFDGQFNGPVGVSEALRRSLNVPAVQLLSHLKPERFVARLAGGGLRLHLPAGAHPNPALILGGTGSTLEDLVAAFASLARGGVSGKLRLTEDASAAPRYFMSAGAAWIVRHILSQSPRPGLNSTPAVQSNARAIAWKTGTSYGYRDAWSLGVDARHTVGVWVGRPDGTPMPGHYGAVTAAPMMFSIFDMLPADHSDGLQHARPGNVSEVEICLPLGTPPEAGREQLCHMRRRALVLDGVTPRTLPDSDAIRWQDLVRSVWINPASGRRVTAACRAPGSRVLEIARWPLALHPWLSRDILARSSVPALDDDCATRHAGEERSLRISGIADGVELRRGADGALPRVSLKVLGAAGRTHWLVDGRVEQSGAATRIFTYRFATTGPHRVTAVDESGSHSSVSVRVR
jgi:penicillin-binding protein 1C